MDYFKEDEPKPKPMKKCEVCGTTEFVKVCSRCQKAVYCSPTHQKEHWPIHKRHCKQALPFLIEESEDDLSKEKCVATKDLEKGALIMEEVPIFHYNPTSEVTRSGQCVTCGINLKDANDPKKRDKYRCSLCAWPVCSVECELAAVHSKNECRIFQENNAEYPEELERRQGDDGKTLGEFVMIARAFSLRCQNPQLWEEILDICPMYTLDEFNGLTDLLMSCMMIGKSVTPIKSCFPKFLQEEDKNVRDEILAQITVLGRRVGFPVSTELGEENMSMLRMYLFKTASYITHSCSANCVWNIGPFPDFKIRIRAAVSIKKGERLTVNRQGHLYFGTRNRQILFQERFKRYCQCRQCADPSELGTFQSGIACTRCRDEAVARGYQKDFTKWGYLLPQEPLNERRAKEDVAEWQCSMCGDVQPASIFLKRLNEIYKSLKKVEREGVKEKIEEEVTTLLKKEVGSFLHPNHFVVQHAQNALQQSQSKFPIWDEGTEDDDEEIRKRRGEILKQDFEQSIQRLEYQLAIMDKTCPGLQQERVRHLLLLGDGLLSLCQKNCDPKTFFKKTKEEALLLETRLMKSSTFLEDALMYWNGTFVARGDKELKHVDHLKDRIAMAKNLMQLVQARLADFHKEPEEEVEDDEE